MESFRDLSHQLQQATKGVVGRLLALSCQEATLEDLAMSHFVLEKRCWYRPEMVHPYVRGTPTNSRKAGSSTTLLTPSCSSHICSNHLRYLQTIVVHRQNMPRVLFSSRFCGEAGTTIHTLANYRTARNGFFPCENNDRATTGDVTPLMLTPSTRSLLQ